MEIDFRINTLSDKYRVILSFFKTRVRLQSRNINYFLSIYFDITFIRPSDLKIFHMLSNSNTTNLNLVFRILITTFFFIRFEIDCALEIIFAQIHKIEFAYYLLNLIQRVNFLHFTISTGDFTLFILLHFLR